VEGVMPLLSDAPGKPPLNQKLEGKFVPFTIFLKADPFPGNRSEKIKYLERQAARIEDQLEDFCDTGSDPNLTFDFAKPVAFTVQFGEQTARYTVTGHVCKRASFTKLPFGEQLVVSDNREQTGIGAGNASNIEPAAEVNIIAENLKDDFETATGLEVIRVEIAGYIYGFKGVHIPI
jgi:hypothetical protein